jgi:hypothetical protein
MAKKKKGSGVRSGDRTRINPLTGQAEQVTGTRSGKKRALLPYGHPLRTHDLKPAGSKKKRHEALMNRDKSKD